jgi:hypothetical protein
MPTKVLGGARAWICPWADPETLAEAPELGSFAPFRDAVDAHGGVDPGAPRLGSFAPFRDDPAPDPVARGAKAPELGSFAPFRADVPRAGPPGPCRNG